MHWQRVGKGCHQRPHNANDKRIRDGDEPPGDKYRNHLAGAQFRWRPSAVSGGHHAVRSSYPPSLDLLKVLDGKGNKFVLRMNSETSV